MRVLKSLFSNRLAHSSEGASPAREGSLYNVPEYDPILYGLASPQYHRLKLGENNLFSGCVLALGNKSVRGLAVFSNGKLIGTFPVDSPREDIAATFPHLAGAKRCGFDFELLVEPAYGDLIFDIIFDDGSREFFFKYDLSLLKLMSGKFAAMQHTIDGIKLPDGDLIFMTQGHRDVNAYANSIIPFIVNVRRYLEHCGIDIEGLRTILDFGCGSGRALVGWYADDPGRKLLGCDINDELVSWAKKNLPKAITFDRTFMEPPLPYAGSSVDMVELISVFTHLLLDTQKRWIREFQRILKPGGYLLVTLQGEAYVRLFGSGSEDFKRSGYFENSGATEGSNGIGTYHALGFVKNLFDGFEVIGYFSEGKIRGERVLFQIASQQDVYLLRLRD
ncbi:MAG: hypothetical protein H6Q92_48 [Nitrospirae bacterium]|nr:hypothetical protein [Nitrospirota bacterium]